MALLYDKAPNGLVPLKIKLPQSLASSTITALRIQDIARDVWYSWDKNSTYPNGYWDNSGGGGKNAPVGQTPMVTPGTNTLYIAFFAVNGYSYQVNMTLYIYDANYNILASTVNFPTNPNVAAEVEWTGNMPTTPYEIILYSQP